MTPTEAPGLIALPDLESQAELSLDPEYVLAYLPPCLYARIWDRIVRSGWWELVTVADYHAGNPAGDGWSLNAPRTGPETRLGAWVTDMLGYPVALDPDTTALKADRSFTRWHTEPLYWVRRNT
jgi:hypothetical protein